MTFIGNSKPRFELRLALGKVPSNRKLKKEV